ncbi:hypothetical protein [Ornithinimicrobium pratense]|uniref:hypothetical protein n=1 Tax=Ornithinimicrobium pratense TaxID=2593973 RepID=UPI001788839A|nr:hypothetical protein [Ornithinimicrobium pratense]
MDASRAPEPVTVVDNTRVGITVLCAFGVAWTLILIPLSALSTPLAVVATGIAVLWAGVLWAVARGRDFAQADAAVGSELSAAQRRRVFVITNLAQAVIFSVAISICIATGRIGWVPLIAALVVGLHFLPLARVFAESIFGVAGLVLAVLGGTGLVLALMGAVTVEVAVAITAVAAAITLLTAATVLLARYGTREAMPAQPPAVS